MPKGSAVYEFGPFRLEPGERRLLRDGGPIPLPPKAFDLLAILVEHPDRLLKKEELIERLWPGVFVEEVNLAQNISALRRALGGDKQLYIQTVSGAGYRFAAPVQMAVPSTGGQSGRRADAAAAPPLRLIVLPFRMLKPDAAVEFLAFSLPDALTAALSALDSVVVRSSLVAARFAGDAPDLKRIAREADVGLVLSGTLLRAGDQLRASAQLADAAAGTLIWSHTEQAPVDDLFRLQDALVERIARSLSGTLTDRERRQLRRDVPATAKAYEYYLRGNQASQDSTAWTVARDLYRQALEEDPDYAPAWTRLARVYRLLGKYRKEGADANLERAEEALQRALAVNPELSMAQNLYAQIEVDRGRAEHAMVRLLEQAQRRDADPELFAGLVHACRYCGLLDASLAAHARAQRLDPTIATSVMHTYFLKRRYDDVLTSPGVIKGYVFLLSLAGLGRVDEALRTVAELRTDGHRTPELVVSAQALIEGRTADSLAALDEAARIFADPEAFYYAARQYAFLGEARRSLDALARAVGSGYFCYAATVTDPWFDPLRENVEFQALLGRSRQGERSVAAVFRNAGGPAILEVSG